MTASEMKTAPAAVAARPAGAAGPHVLFACHDFSVGGHSTHTLNLARALRRRGYRAGVIVPEPFGGLYRDFTEGLDYICIERRGLESRAGYVRRLVGRITALNPGVLINNAVPSVQAALPFLPPAMRRISVVHNYVEHEVALGLAHGDWVDWAVAVSDNVREFMDRKNSGKVALATIPVGIEAPARERQQDKAVTPLRLIYVGRLEAQKNIPGLLKVLAHLHQAGVPFKMTVAGGGKELESAKAEAAASAYAGQIEFLGVRTQGQVAALLDENDFLLMTSHYEGTPHAMLEAMAHGLVVVASRLPGATDRIVDHGVNGYLCDRNAPEEYVSILKRFASGLSGMGGLSAAARKTALSRYSTDQLAGQYEKLFTPPDGGTPERKQYTGSGEPPAELLRHFPGVVLQGKHRVADLWRRVSRGVRPHPSKNCA